MVRFVAHPPVRLHAGVTIPLNTEDLADIVPPCQGLIGLSSSDDGVGASDPALAEGGVIGHRRGIAGGADLVPGVHGWTDPVAQVTVTRVG